MITEDYSPMNSTKNEEKYTIKKTYFMFKKKTCNLG